MPGKDELLLIPRAFRHENGLGTSTDEQELVLTECAPLLLRVVVITRTLTNAES
jgi:hypothetical protein